jgi:hypothetical protein
MSEPARARAVFSTQDFQLVREALLFFMQAHQGTLEAEKFSHLYHRLGSAAVR